jgi:hypothetical protein
VLGDTGAHASDDRWDTAPYWDLANALYRQCKKRWRTPRQACIIQTWRRRCRIRILQSYMAECRISSTRSTSPCDCTVPAARLPMRCANRLRDLLFCQAVMNDTQLQLQLPLANSGSLLSKEANSGKTLTRCRARHRRAPAVRDTLGVAFFSFPTFSFQHFRFEHFRFQHLRFTPFRFQHSSFRYFSFRHRRLKTSPPVALPD